MAESAVEVAEPPKMPRISVNIFFGPHQTAEDLEKFRKEFEQADVYIQEFAGWNEDQLEGMRQISDGDIGTLNIILANPPPKDFSREKLMMIFNSHKPIAFVDVPSNHSLAVELSKKKRELSNPRLASTFTQNLDEIRKFWREFGQLEAQRDEYMLSQIKPNMQELLKEYPFLKLKRKLNILMSLGSIHSTILERDKNIRSVNEGKAYEYSFPMEAMRKGQMGEAIDDELAAKVFVDTYFSKELTLLDKLAGENSEKRIKLRREIVSCFSLEDASEMFDRLKKGDKAEVVFKEKARQRGVYLKLPQT